MKTQPNIKIIFGGGGNSEQSKDVDMFFLKILDRKKRLLYIPLAMNPEKHPYDGCLDWIKSVFVPLGFKDIDMWTDLHGKTYKDLEQYGGIYIGGGNTFRLLDAIQKSDFFLLLKRFAQSGRTIYGGSAGAIVLGKTINTTSDENKIGLKNLNGLDILNGYNIKCHYTDDKYESMSKLSQESHIPIIAIPEDAGVIFMNGNLRCVCKENFVLVFVDKNIKKYKNKEIITTQ